MKQIFIIILLTLSFSQDYPVLGSDNSLDILTWNVEHYPKHNQTNTYLEDIITQIDIDIIALQEIENQNAFNNLINLLGGGWEGYRSANTQYGEVSYLINTDEIEIVSLYTILGGNAYYFAYREPYVLEFIHEGNSYVMINNHFKCCGDDVLDLNDSGDEEYRRLIASQLLHEYVENNFNFDRVIILGDLNDEITDSQNNNVFLDFIDSDFFQFADNDIAYGPSLNWSFPTWPSHIDHIIVSDELYSDFNFEDVETFKVDQYLNGGWSAYDQYISDHRPVFIKIDFNEILGDINNDQILNILDVVMIVQIVLGNESSNDNADFNQDSSIDILDIVQLIQIIIND